MDTIIELNFNVDDMTAEQLGFAMDILLEAGARDVFFIPVTMKKNRPGTLVTVITTEDMSQEIIELIFKYTTTIGIREKLCQRYVLDRTIETVDSKFGPVRKKTVSGYGVTQSKYEYDDLSKIAKEKNLSIQEILDQLD